ncbi:MAG: DUF502 domain-containing protein [Acidobacteria bacterium]|nr:DUF502 domain-containing protein [Acidobacteriota bacterium]
MSTLMRAFLRGALAVVPLGVTIYLLYWLATTAEQVLGPPIRHLLPDGLYVPGMGVAAGFLLVLGLGVLLQLYLVRRAFLFFESSLNRIPLIKTLYGSLRDLVGFFSEAKQREMSQVVMVDPLGNGHRMLGFVTRDEWSTMPAGLGGDDLVAVYLPMSYQLGGFTLVLPRSHVQPIAMRMEEAMRFAVTAGVASDTER